MNEALPVTVAEGEPVMCTAWLPGEIAPVVANAVPVSLMLPVKA
jgi:hypothetical protein